MQQSLTTPGAHYPHMPGIVTVNNSKRRLPDTKPMTHQDGHLLKASIRPY